MSPVTRSARASSIRLAVTAATLFLHAAAPSALRSQAPDHADRVEVIRTEYGVPHIYADDLRAAGYALGYLQLEDYGDRVVRGLVRARGELSVRLSANYIDMDAANRHRYRRAAETYLELEAGTRDVLEGFAAGVNRYVALHPREFSAWGPLHFTGQDVHALGIGSPSAATVNRYLAALERAAPRPVVEEVHPEDGSNAWALAPSRTTSGRAILMRNPHLSWDAGYYEAHLIVPGKLDFYGDFRIGGPLGIIGGFNRHLGWSTTNNYPQLEEIYVLSAVPGRSDHYLLDGASHPLRVDSVEVDYRDADGEIGRVWRTSEHTSLGPVIHRDAEHVHVIRSADEGEFRMGEQFLRLMLARNLEEWKEGMRIQARTSSNFVYADADGNIFYVWNAALPSLPHPAGDGLRGIPISRSDEAWQEIVPFDSLPQLLNPEGGYVRNENDPFHFTNLHEPIMGEGLPPNTPAPQLRLRSQHGIELLHNDRLFSLEDVVEAKHSMPMLLADRVKDELVGAVLATRPTGEVRQAIELIERWDNTVAAKSRGGLLFETWWDRYQETTPARHHFREPWSVDHPATTPRGIGDRDRAAEAFQWAVVETAARHGGWDLAWGQVHRVRHGSVDAPVGGCSGTLGCYRVLGFRDESNGRRTVTGGDGWVFAVEFGETLRAYSVLAYGQSARARSPHFSDQARMFAENRMKPVHFDRMDIERHANRRYRPGLQGGD